MVDRFLVSEQVWLSIIVFVRRKAYIESGWRHAVEMNSLSMFLIDRIIRVRSCEIFSTKRVVEIEFPTSLLLKITLLIESVILINTHRSLNLKEKDIMI